MQITSLKIDNTGAVYVLGAQLNILEQSLDKSTNNRIGNAAMDYFHANQPNYFYSLYVFYQNGKKLYFKKINLDTLFLRSLDFQPVQLDSIICFGIWSSNGMFSAKGSFLFQLDMEEGSIQNPTFFEFSPDITASDLTADQLAKFRNSMQNPAEYDPFGYRLSGLMTLNNGEMFFSAERYLEGSLKQISWQNTASNNIHAKIPIVVSYPTYYYADILIIRISSDGTILRTDKVKKQQHTLRRVEYSSFFTFQNDNCIQLVYNDIPYWRSNKKVSEKMELKLVSVNPEGGLESYSVHQNNTKVDPLYMPVTTLVSAAGELTYIRFKYNKMKYQYEKIEVKKRN